RAGLIAALVMLGSPLFVLQSRQLISDVGSITGATVAMLGLAGLGWPKSGRYRELATAGRVLLAAAGPTPGFLAAGIVIGVAIPLLSVAIAQGIAVLGRWGDQEKRRWPGQVVAAGLAGAAALVAIIIPLREIVHFTDAVPGQLTIFGKSIKVIHD